jgi:hypothetical protein
MAYVDSNSTMAQVEAAYDDTAQYDMGGGVTMAKEHVVACRVLLRRLNTEMSRGDLSVKKRIESIEQELKQAKAWVVANDTVSSTTHGRGFVRYHDMSDYRE